ncbi:hypothetical protein [Streptomyces sp. RP5T]|nr:hypothetical protein [Streptomyces sp. RP5T]
MRPGGEGLRLIALSGFSQGTDRALSRTAKPQPLSLTELTEILARRAGD